MSANEWPLWEVFIRAKRGVSHVHAGSLHAPDAEMALRNARDIYTRRQEGVSIWVVEAERITASSPDEKDAFFEPAGDKVYRHPSFYDVPEGVEHLVSADLFTYTLRLADDSLLASQRMGEWIASAPQIEEDVALGNIALDLLGQARALLTYAGRVEGDGRGEDDLAYLRDERDFLNAQIFELANGDFGFTIARLLITSTYQYELYDALQSSTDETLAAVAAKAIKEVDYHRDHATQWTLRLGDGTEESHRRMQAGLDAVWPYVAELFETDELVARLAVQGVAVDPSALEESALAYIHGVLQVATLELPQVAKRPTGGRRGIHTEQMGYLLAEMQHLARSHPGASW